MDTTMALMLSRSVEDDRRRTIMRRPSGPRLGPATDAREKLSLAEMYRIPRLSLDPSKA